MKSIKLFSVVILSFFFLTSCTKDEMKDVVNQTLQNSSISVGFEVAGVPVQLSLGGGTGMYYDQQYYNSYQCPSSGSNYYDNNTNVTVCYIVSKPFSQTAIVVFDKNGHAIATVSSVNGNWQQDNAFFLQLQNWNYSNGPCAVLVQWDPKWTSGPWSGKIIG